MTIWKDYPNTTTPLTAAALNGLEQRVTTALTTATTSITTVQQGLETLTGQIREKFSTNRIRMGTIRVSSVPRTNYQNFTVTFDRPLSSANYVVIVTLGGTNAYSPELMSASVITNGKTNRGFAGRVRNNANSAQGCEVSYIAIEA